MDSSAASSSVIIISEIIILYNLLLFPPAVSTGFLFIVLNMNEQKSFNSLEVMPEHKGRNVIGDVALQDSFRSIIDIAVCNRAVNAG